MSVLANLSLALRCLHMFTTLSRTCADIEDFVEEARIRSFYLSCLAFTATELAIILHRKIGSSPNLSDFKKVHGNLWVPTPKKPRPRDHGG